MTASDPSRLSLAQRGAGDVADRAASDVEGLHSAEIAAQKLATLAGENADLAGSHFEATNEARSRA